MRRAGAAPLEPWLEEEPIQAKAPAREPEPAEPEELLLLEEAPELELLEAEQEDASPTARPSPRTPGWPPVLTPVEPSNSSADLWTTRPLVPAAAKPPPPLKLGPSAPKAGEDDLWRIVTFDRPDSAEGFSSSFEAALSQVQDSHLEALIQTDVARTGSDANEPPVEAIVEATIEEAPAFSIAASSPGDKAGSAGQTLAAGLLEDDLDDLGDLSNLDDWAFDEDELVGDPSNPEDAKLRRQRLLRRAMANMGALGGGAPRAGTAPAATPAAAPAAESASAAASGNKDEARLAQQIEQRYAEIQSGRDHFAVLGVPQTVQKEQVKAAFLTLAKVFHPDRLPQSLAHLSPRMTSVFEAIREAYEVLHDDTRRGIYLQGLQKAARPAPVPGTAPSSASRSEGNPGDLFKMGEVYLRKREFATATEHYERAYALDPKPLYLAARGWSVYMDPARKADAAKAKQMMADALRTDPNCDRAHYQLGVIARVEGDMDRAERHFREAIRANPKHLEANQELRLIDMRKRNNPAGKKGLFR
jgi:curved DNA-binding protein CbpA